MLLYICDSCAGNQLSLQAVNEGAVPELDLTALLLMASAPNNKKPMLPGNSLASAMM